MSNRKWLPLNALRAFEAVARHMSFTLGAQALSVGQSAVSRHVASLEDVIGQRLFVRKAQGLELTKAGETLLPAINRSFDRLEQALDEIKSIGAGGGRTLRVHFPPSFLHQLALPLIAEFRAGHPDIAIEVTSSNATGGPPQDCDLAILFDRPSVSEAIRDLLWLARLTPVCSPAAAARFAGRPPEDLLTSLDLLQVRIDGRPAVRIWSAFASRVGVVLPQKRGLTFETMTLAVQYAMASNGIALADIDMFANEIAGGELVAPFPIALEDGYGYYLTLAPEGLDDPVIATFRSWIIARFAGGFGRPGWDDALGHRGSDCRIVALGLHAEAEMSSETPER